MSTFSGSFSCGSSCGSACLLDVKCSTESVNTACQYRMCLSENSLTQWWIDGSHSMCTEDFDQVDKLFRHIWTKLDHTRRYCLNPMIVAHEILRLSRSDPQPEVIWFDSEAKSENYRRLIADLWRVAFSDAAKS